MICGFLQDYIQIRISYIATTLTTLELAILTTLEVLFFTRTKVECLGVLFCKEFLIFKDIKMVAYGLDKESQFWAYFFNACFYTKSINFDLNIELSWNFIKRFYMSWFFDIWLKFHSNEVWKGLVKIALNFQVNLGLFFLFYLELFCCFSSFV